MQLINEKNEQRKQLIKEIIAGKNLKIAILGFGITGKSLLEWASISLSKDNHYYIIDKKFTHIKEESLASYIPEAESNHIVNLADFILPSPGFAITPEITLRNNIITEFDLFFFLIKKKFSKMETILITGSVGKTSSSSLISQCLEKLGKKTILCGNIGIPVLSIVNQIKKKNVIVIEASSTQLEHSLLVCPTYFIITNIYYNHLDCHTSFKKYYSAKLSPLIHHGNKMKKIILDQSAYSYLISDYKEYFLTLKNKIIIVQEDKSEEKTKFVIYLKNNSLYYFNKNKKTLISCNSLPSISFKKNWAYILGICYQYSKKINFFSNSHFYIPDFRLQKIIDNKDWVIFNDSKSTIIESTEKALKEIKKNYPTETCVVIIGGLSKGVSRISGIERIEKENCLIYLFGKEITLFQKELGERKKIYFIEKLEDILIKIKNQKNRIESSRIVVLFSPGGSSFDQFNSYIDRGKKFNELAFSYFT
jgi:UDP-N-acetylmuramoylalanine--D-glutamate ligase